MKPMSRSIYFVEHKGVCVQPPLSDTCYLSSLAASTKIRAELVKYRKPEIVMHIELGDGIESSSRKDGWIAEMVSPYLCTTAAAYEADD